MVYEIADVTSFDSFFFFKTKPLSKRKYSSKITDEIKIVKSNLQNIQLFSKSNCKFWANSGPV